jgi:chromosome segregation ATPase
MNNDNINQIEIALRDGLIEELAQATETSVSIITRLSNLIKHYEDMNEQWEQQNRTLIEVLSECVEQRDRARALAVKLEQECHSCNDTVHHGNEEVYDGTI